MVAADLPVLLRDEAVGHGLGKLDYGHYSAILLRVDFGELFGELFGVHDFAPPVGSVFSDPNAASICPYSGQQLYFGFVGVLDRHRQPAHLHWVVRELPLDGVPHVFLDLRGRLVHQGGLIQYKKDVNVTETIYVRAFLDGTAEHGLHDMVTLVSEKPTQAFEVPSEGFRIPTVVYYEQVFAVLIEIVVRHRSFLRLRLDEVVQGDDGQALDAAEVGFVGD